jgi:ribonuclease HII
LDEVGRGALAGPVVAAAVILDPAAPLPEGLNDSKKLTASRRERIAEELRERAVCYAVGLVPPDEIDRTNILIATRRAMVEALEKLNPCADFLLIDALQLKESPLPQRAIIGGDAISASIAAASVIAKTHRDALMKDYDTVYPRYGFGRHVGYGTRAHLEALRAHGACPIHRRSFRGVLPAEGEQVERPSAPHETIAPEIETARARLRMFTLDDLDDLHAILSDPEVVRHVGTGLPITREETEAALKSIISHWERRGTGRWAVTDKASGRLIGWAGLRLLEGTPEVVYLLTKDYWGNGLATEVARACLSYGFDRRHFGRIVAIAMPANLASQRVMEKLGMRREGEARYYGYDVVRYAILREEFTAGDA